MEGVLSVLGYASLHLISAWSVGSRTVRHPLLPKMPGALMRAQYTTLQMLRLFFIICRYLAMIPVCITRCTLGANA